jgi:hypothetical protein
MKEVSVKRNDSSLREGHGVERRVSEEVSLSFWRGNGGEEEEEEGRESSRISASWRTKGSEKVGAGWSETLVLVLALGALMGVWTTGMGGLWMWGVKAKAAMDGGGWEFWSYL